MNENDEILEKAKEFHGHLGPYAVTGLKMGYYAVKRLQARRHFGMRVEVECPPKPPPSCVVDGLQFSTGCTMGKANIKLLPAQEIRATFTNTDTQESLTLRVNQQTLDRLGTDEAAARQVWKIPDQELFSEEPG